MKKKLVLIQVCLASMFLLSCGNIFEGGAKKTGDAAKMMEARIKMNKYDWTGAITVINSMTTKYKTRRDVKYLLASAYLGRCGLDFLDFANNVKDWGTSNLLQVLMREFPGATTAQIDDCVLAEATIQTISTEPTLRYNDENVLAAFIGLAKVAVIISANFDLDADGVLDAGTVSNDVCDSTLFVNTDVAEVGAGLISAYNSLTQVNSSIGQAVTGSIGALCSLNICDITDASSVTALQRTYIRGIVLETTDGLGLKIVGGDTAANACEF